MTDDQVYSTLCRYASKQLKGSNTLGNYDYMDVAHDCYLRYLRKDWNMEHPKTYLWMVVSSTIKNLHKQDKRRGYKETQQLKVRSSNHDSTVWLSEDEDDWNTELLDKGPETYVMTTEAITKLFSWADRHDRMERKHLEQMAIGNSANVVARNYPASRTLFYKDLQSMNNHARIIGIK
jgi:DNA-directed RNA polymerase specialized sigma24 family protein